MGLWPWEVHCVTVGVHQGLLSLSCSFPKQRTLYRPQYRPQTVTLTAFWGCLWAGLVAQHPVPGWARQQHWGWAAQPLIQNFLGEGGRKPTLGQSELCLWQQQVAQMVIFGTQGPQLTHRARS